MELRSRTRPLSCYYYHSKVFSSFSIRVKTTNEQKKNRNAPNSDLQRGHCCAMRSMQPIISAKRVNVVKKHNGKINNQFNFGSTVDFRVKMSGVRSTYNQKM